MSVKKGTKGRKKARPKKPEKAGKGRKRPEKADPKNPLSEGHTVREIGARYWLPVRGLKTPNVLKRP
jgi:hypothetical protein